MVVQIKPVAKPADWTKMRKMGCMMSRVPGFEGWAVAVYQPGDAAEFSGIFRLVKPIQILSVTLGYYKIGNEFHGYTKNGYIYDKEP